MAKTTTPSPKAKTVVADALYMPLKPRMSEKTYGLSLLRNTFVFDVPKTANKITVKAAVEAQFKVTVEEVNIVVVKGKVKQSYRKRGRVPAGKDSDVKKAYVRLKAGDSIPVFAAIEEAEAADKKAKKSSAKAQTRGDK